MTKNLNRTFKLSESLLVGKNPLERRAVEDCFKSATAFLRSFADRLENKLEDKIKDSESIQQYLNTNWNLYQADNRGYRRAIRDVLNMFAEYK